MAIVKYLSLKSNLSQFTNDSGFIKDISNGLTYANLKNPPTISSDLNLADTAT